METAVGVALLFALLIIGLNLIRIRHLFAAAMLMGFFSLLSAAYYVVVDAVDVAFTEAAVGAGLSTVLMLGALSLTTRLEKLPQKLNSAALIISLAAGSLLLYGLSDVPVYGAADAPVHAKTAPAWHYIHQSEAEIGVPNIVTSVLASYRGYDTFGETTVIFTAGIAVFMLLAGYRRKENSVEG